MSTKMNRSKARRPSRQVGWPVIACLPLMISQAYAVEAVPTGGVVTAGTATIVNPTAGSVLIKQTTPRAIIKWSDFSIARGNSVTFAQPDARSATLNIVKGNSASVLAGTLKADGSVVLINQNGISITPDGLVDTRTGFIASTLDLGEEAFMAGRLEFSGKGGAVMNRGTIMTGAEGAVALLGSFVSNEGTIRAPLGKVALASGSAATLDLSGDGFLQVMLPADAAGADGQALVSNSGVIEADGGSVVLKASTVRQALRDAVNMPGTIQARSLAGRDGAVVLEAGPGGAVRVGGTIDVSATANGANGGAIAVTGNTVDLAGATLTATGESRGGLVRIGGAFQGGRAQAAESVNGALFAGRFGAMPTLDNALKTTVDANSTINVSATGNAGVGGTVVVWSDLRTDVAGSVTARGTAAGGAVEISSKKLVGSLNLKQVDIGRGGTLLLDPQDIVINATGVDLIGDYSYGDAPGMVTRLKNSELTALLSTGVSVNLQASQDIWWINNNFNELVQRTPSGPGGNLNLSAGRSVYLNGYFSTADGNWNIVANDRAENGVVDAERGAGSARIGLNDAWFLGSNGKLTLTMSDGAGNTNNRAGGIAIRDFNGDSLTATVLPDAFGDYLAPIEFGGNINVAGAIDLRGNLQFRNDEYTIDLRGNSVTWHDEKNGGVVNGYGRMRFIENDITTRIGLFRSFSRVSVDSFRLELGNAVPSAATKVYGDSNPSFADLALPFLRLASHSKEPTSAIDFSTLLKPGSLQVSGPSPRTPVGAAELRVEGSSTAAFALDGYFLDLTPVSVPLTITPRALTATVSDASYTYGQTAVVAALGNVVAGDSVTPLATLGGNANVVMNANGAGFGFRTNVPAGMTSFNVTGITGTDVANYTFDAANAQVANLDIARKSLNYSIVDPLMTSMYGDGMARPYAVLAGVINGDWVDGTVVFASDTGDLKIGSRLPVGVYRSMVNGLEGSRSGNYFIAPTGNTDGTHEVTKRPLHIDLNTQVSTIYGSAATVPLSVLKGPTGRDPAGFFLQMSGVQTGDDVRMVFDGPALTPRTPADTYFLNFSALEGSAAANYSITTPQPGVRLTIERKPITYTGATTSQVYGTPGVPTPVLNGVLDGDDVVGDLFNLQGTGNVARWPLAVGQYSYSPTRLAGAAGSNYVLAVQGNTSSVFNVTPKPVTFAFGWGEVTTIYGDLAAAPNVDLVGKIGNDALTASMNFSAYPGNVSLGERTPAGKYTLQADKVLSGADAGNYMLEGPLVDSFNLTVNPKPVNVTVSSYGPTSSVYGDALPNMNFSFDGRLPGDVLGATLGLVNGMFNLVTGLPGVDNMYRLTATALTGSSAGNYTIGQINAQQWEITPRSLTFKLGDTESVYGTLAPKAAITFDNLVAGDTASATWGYSGIWLPTERSSAGVFQAGSVRLVDSPNYQLDYAGSEFGKLTILPKPVTFSTPSVYSVYGTAATAAQGALGGILFGDDVKAGATVLEGGGLLRYDLDAGMYSLVPQLTGGHAPNYVLDMQNSSIGTLNVAKSVVRFSAELYNGDKRIYTTYDDPRESASTEKYSSVYGELAPPGSAGQGVNLRTGFYSVNGGGIVDADRLTATIRQPVIPLSSSGNLRAGSYEFWAGVLEGNTRNYELDLTQSNLIAKLKISPATLEISPRLVKDGIRIADGVSVEYGQSARVSTENAFAPLQGPTGIADVVSVPLSFRRFDLSGNGLAYPQLTAYTPVGEYFVEVNGALRGADGANYVAGAMTNTKVVTVTPKSVSIAAGEQRWTYGSPIGLNTPGASNGEVLGLLQGDRVTGLMAAYQNGKEVDPNIFLGVGQYVINPVGLAGSDAANYAFVPFGEPGYSTANRSNILTINPRPVLIGSSTVGDASLTYGDEFYRRYSIISGALPQHGLQLGTAVTRESDNAVLPLFGSTLLGAGSYTVGATVSNPNYVITYQNGSPQDKVEVAKRVLTVPFATTGLVYGTEVPLYFFAKNTINGDIVYAKYSVFNPTTGNSAETYHGRFEVGSYSFGFESLVRGSLANYILPTVPLTIRPRELTYAAAGPTTVAYGANEAIHYATLSGSLAGDDVRVQSNSSRPMDTFVIGGEHKTLRAPAGYHVEDFAIGLAAPFVEAGYQNVGPRRYYTVDSVDRPLLQVGTHPIKVSTDGRLFGRAANNYFLAPGESTTTVTITPKGLTVPARTVQYGFYNYCVSRCGPWDQPLASDGVSDFNVAMLQGYASTLYTSSGLLDSALRATVSYVDATGKSVTIDANTPVGRYFQQVTGLQGTAASNYMAGAPTPIDVVPLSLRYTTSSAIFLNGVGLIGTPGIPTLHGPKGEGGINGDDVYGNLILARAPNGSLVPDLSSLVEGRYVFSLAGLGGANAGNYRILQEGSDLGTLDVFVDTSFGLRRVGTTTVPIVPPYAPPMPPSRADTTSLVMPVTGEKNFARSITTTGTSTGVQITSISTTVVANASGTTVQTTTLGNGTLSGQASGSAKAGATAGPTGAKASASLDGHVDATVTSGVGFASAGAQANASVDVGADRTGLTATAKASIGANASGGASGSLGAAGNGTISSTVKVGATADSTNNATYKDGKIVVKSDSTVGAVVSAGINGGITGKTGSVNAGATVYAPGSLGASAGAKAAYNDSGLSLGLDLGVKIGLGGAGFKIDVTISREKFEGAFSPVISFFGGTAYKEPTAAEKGTKALDYANSLAPLAKLSYLKTTNEWKNAPGAYAATAKVKDFDAVLTAYPELVRKQQETQATLLRLLATDPAAAIAYAHSNDFRAVFEKEELDIPKRAAQLGLKYVVTNGVMTLQNR